MDNIEIGRFVQVTTNELNMYFVVAETDDEICLKSRIDGKLSVFDVNDDLLRKDR